MAEIMFETFNVKGLFVGVQAVLALYAGVAATKGTVNSRDLTGTVVDSGDGVTHVIPVADSFPITESIMHIPIAGRNITEFMVNALRDRKEPIPTTELRKVAQDVKEEYCYLSPDIVKEHLKFDREKQ